MESWEEWRKRVMSGVMAAWTQIRTRLSTIQPRRAAAAVVALSLWMGAGTMAGSAVLEIQTEQAGETFGEVHWYVG